MAIYVRPYRDRNPAEFWARKGRVGAMGCAASVHSSTKPQAQRYNFVGPELRSPAQLEAVDWSDLCGLSVRVTSGFLEFVHADS